MIKESEVIIKEIAQNTIESRMDEIKKRCGLAAPQLYIDGYYAGFLAATSHPKIMRNRLEFFLNWMKRNEEELFRYDCGVRYPLSDKGIVDKYLHDLQ